MVFYVVFLEVLLDYIIHIRQFKSTWRVNTCPVIIYGDLSGRKYFIQFLTESDIQFPHWKLGTCVLVELKSQGNFSCDKVRRQYPIYRVWQMWFITDVNNCVEIYIIDIYLLLRFIILLPNESCFSFGCTKCLQCAVIWWHL